MESFPHISLDCLTERQRDVVEWRYCGNPLLSFRAVALIMSLDVKTVWEHHQAAMRKLEHAIPQQPTADK